MLFLHTDSTHLSKSELFLQPELTDDNFCSRDFLCVFTIASMFADVLDNVFLRVDDIVSRAAFKKLVQPEDCVEHVAKNPSKAESSLHFE